MNSTIDALQEVHDWDAKIERKNVFLTDGNYQLLKESE